MRIMVSGATTPVDELARTPLSKYLGVMVTPVNGNCLKQRMCQGLPLVADYAAFSNFDPRKLWNLIIDLWELPSMVKWVTAPDVVGDAKATLERFFVFRDEIHHEIGHIPVRLAFVAQDGMESIADQIPWQQFDCLFIGGTTQWKLGPHARRCCAEARERKKWLHVGRVNSHVRLRYCRDILKAHSVDGGSYSRFPKARLIPALQMLARDAAKKAQPPAPATPVTQPTPPPAPEPMLIATAAPAQGRRSTIVIG